MANILVTAGTQTSVRTVTIAGNEYQQVVVNNGTASDNPFTGTILAVTNLANGTIAALTKGTVVGTVDAVSQFPPNPWQVTVSTGTTTLGTIKAAVAGSAIFVTDLIISAGSATNVVIGAGGTSTPLIGTLSFAQYGGMAYPFSVPGSVTAGSALVYQQSVGCTLTVYAAGFVR